MSPAEALGWLLPTTKRRQKPRVFVENAAFFRERLERARELRRRVQELNAIALTIADRDAKSGVLAAAETYARLANEIEADLGH